MTRRASTTPRPVEEISEGAAGIRRRLRRDQLATEEPLEIRIVPSGAAPEARHPISVTMRTPGADFELAAGFLYGEGLISAREEVAAIRYCVDASRDGVQQYNAVNVHLAPGAPFDPGRLARNFYATSSCGVCGKASIEALRETGCPVPTQPLTVASSTLLALPERLRAAQTIFERTGGLHAAALFDSAGALVSVREDVGRHNAMDKLVGAALLDGSLPWAGRIVLLSGRLSFELVQKAARAGAGILAGVSAPSSLAVELGEAYGLTVVGFLRDSRFNVYCGGERVST